MRWQCTRRACPVYIHLDEEMNLIHPPSREHRHPTIRLHRTAVGTYVKIQHDVLINDSFINPTYFQSNIDIFRDGFRKKTFIKKRFFCSRKNLSIKQSIDKISTLILSFPVNIFMTTRGKERLIYRNFTYYKQSRTRNGFRWGCTKNRWHRCKAYLHLSDDLIIVRSNMQHTHPAFVIERKHE